MNSCLIKKQETLPTPPVRTGDPVSDLENGLKAKTDEAVAEGKRDVQQVTQQSAGYVQQAKNLGAATLQSLQVCYVLQTPFHLTTI